MQKIYLALEMEPGINFLLNSWDAMVTFCDLIEHGTNEYSEDVSLHVGLNLDVAHWNLAGIKSSDISQDSTRRGKELIRRHIVHCHLSDHGRGHFADLALGAIHPKSYFDQWLHVIRSLDTQKFSRTVAIELEACKNAQFVNTSLNTLSNILKTSQSPRPLPTIKIVEKSGHLPKKGTKPTERIDR